MGERRSVVTFTTDYGTQDAFVAVCKGVILTQAPWTQVVDVTHQVPRGEVVRGARLLAEAVPYFPRAVHLAVVDPGVGTARRAVALRTGTADLLVGPDNGLLIEAATRLAGVAAAVVIEPPSRPISRTFHGRDLFAPAAARLAAGTSVEHLGAALDPAALVALPAPTVEVSAEVGEAWVRAEVTGVDSFGNVQLAVAWRELTSTGVLPAGRHTPAADPASSQRVRVELPDGRDVTASAVGTFGDVGHGELAVMADSAARVQLAVTGASAAATLGLGAGAVVTLRPAQPG